MSQSENPDQQNLPQDFQQLSQHVQSEILESQKQIQLEKKMSISSIDDDVIDVATMPAFHTLQICLKEIQMNREVIIAMLLKSQEYLSKLYNIFENLEDFEENELLTIIYEIIRNLIFSCDLTVIEKLLDDYYIDLTLGALQYDPNNIQCENFRSLLKNTNFCLEGLINDSYINDTIKKNYRIQFLRDCVIAYQVDEQLNNTLNTIIYYNNQDIINYIIQNEYEFQDIIRQQEITQKIQFFDEFLNLLKQILNISIKQKGIEIIQSCEFFQIFSTYVQNYNNPNVISKLINILINILMISPQMIIQNIQYQNTQFLKSLAKIIQNYDMGIINSAIEFIKQIYDPILECSREIYDQITYEIVQPILQMQMEDDKKLFIIIEIMIQNLKQNAFKTRGFIIQQKLIFQLYKYLQNRKHQLLIIRFIKQIVLQNDEYLIKYVIQNELMEPVIQIYFQNSKKNNLINSCFIEMFQFIYKNNIKKLIINIIQENQNIQIKDKFWQNLKQRFYQYEEFTDIADKPEEQPIQEIKEIIKKPKDQAFLKQLESEEEDCYFSRASDEDQIISKYQPQENQSMKGLLDKMKLDKPIEQTNDSLNLNNKFNIQKNITKPKITFQMSFGTIEQDPQKKIKFE